MGDSIPTTREITEQYETRAAVPMAHRDSTDAAAQVHAAIAHSTDANDRLEHLFARLEEKLYPVLVPSEQPPQPAVAQIEPPMSPVAENIRVQTWRTEGSIERVARLLQRVDV